MKELIIPPAVVDDPRATEVLRAWQAGDALHVSLTWDAWEDPAAWGIVLVDLARHIANAHQQQQGADPQTVLARIREVFEAEWDNPTDEPTGSIVD